MATKAKNAVDQFSALTGGAEKRNGNKKGTATVALTDKDMRKAADAIIAGRQKIKDITEELKRAEEIFKDFGRSEFVKGFAATGAPPASVTYESDGGTLCYIQTSRINMTPEKRQAMRDVGFPIDAHVTVGEVKIDFPKVVELGLEKKLMAALKGLASADELAMILTTPVAAKDSLYAAVGPWASGKPEKVSEALDILEPVVQLKPVAADA